MNPRIARTLWRALLSLALMAMVLPPPGAFLCIERDGHILFAVGCPDGMQPVDLAGHADEGLPDPPLHGSTHNHDPGCHDLRLGAVQTYEGKARSGLLAPDLHSLLLTSIASQGRSMLIAAHSFPVREVRLLPLAIARTRFPLLI